VEREIAQFSSVENREVGTSSTIKNSCPRLWLRAYPQHTWKELVDFSQADHWHLSGKKSPK